MADDKPTTNPFAGPSGGVPQQPVELEFETPPLAFEYPERPEHPDLHRLLQVVEHGASERERFSALKRLTPNYIGVRQMGNGSWWVDIRGRGISASEEDRYRTKRGQAMGLAGDVAEKMAGGNVDLPDNDLCDYASDLIHRNMLRVHAIAETLAEAAKSLEGEELAAILRTE
jgi:hypothetical protein